MQKLNVAVDLGGTHIRTAVADDSLRLFAHLDEPTNHDQGPDGVIDQIVRMARRSVKDSATDWGQIGSVAVGSPGPLDSKVGIVFAPPNLPGWHNVHLKARLEEELQTPVKVANDANAAAFAEFHLGAGRGHDSLVYITVSTGIGGGIVSEGALIEGASGTAGEIGHMTIDRHGPICNCGNRGCLEMIASGTSIARRFNQALAAGEKSAAAEWIGNRKATGADVQRAAEMGDTLALEIFNDAAEAVGFGVVNALHLFNPEIVAIGGGVTKSGKLLFDPINRIVGQYALEVPRKAAKIVVAELGHDVGILGAAAVAWRLEPD